MNYNTLTEAELLALLQGKAIDRKNLVVGQQVLLQTKLRLHKEAKTISKERSTFFAGDHTITKDCVCYPVDQDVLTIHKRLEELQGMSFDVRQTLSQDNVPPEVLKQIADLLAGSGIVSI
jgi:hypothetical protein